MPAGKGKASGGSVKPEDTNGQVTGEIEEKKEDSGFKSDNLAVSCKHNGTNSKTSLTNPAAWTNPAEDQEDSNCSKCCLCVKAIRKKRIPQKAVFVISVVSLVLMSYLVMYEQWVLPYYYTVSFVLLMGIRFYMYFKNQWLLFMLDFCYFANILCFVYIWATPSVSEVFAVLFACSNGPMSWATVIYRNSMVFHSTDKMTSTFIHVLPMFITFSVRWHSESISLHWYTSFAHSHDESVAFLFIWLVAVPLAAFLLHLIGLFVVVQVICRPSDKYTDSYRHLSSDKNWTGKLMGCFGERLKGFMFIFLNFCYCILALLMVPIWYKYYIAHIVYMSIVLMITTWNAASYYVDVYGPRVMGAEKVESIETVVGGGKKKGEKVVGGGGEGVTVVKGDEKTDNNTEKS